MGFFDKLMEMLAANWKTTVAGFVAAVAAFLAEYGVDLSPEVQGQINTLILSAGLFFIGLFAKDGDGKGE